MVQWMKQGALLLEGIFGCLKAQLQASRYVQLDETPWIIWIWEKADAVRVIYGRRMCRASAWSLNGPPHPRHKIEGGQRNP